MQTAKEYILSVYKEVKADFRPIAEEDFIEAKTDNYISVSLCIGKLLETYSNGEFWKTSEFMSDSNNKLKIQHWSEVLKELIKTCLIENIKPKFELNELGYGFIDSEYRNEFLLILQFHEGYLKAQVPKWDLIHWIELGNKLQLIKLKLN